MTNEVHATQPVSQLSVPSDLLERPAAYSVIEELFRIQETMEPRNPFRRVFGFPPVHPDARSWFSGAIGELAVGESLAKLGSEWTVLHSVPVGTGDSDIDHVVIGPAGVFTINTKRHPGKKIWVGQQRMMVSGQKVDHLRNSRHEAKRAAKLLAQASGVTVDVHPVVAIVELASIDSKQTPADVSVLDARAVRRWLERRTAVLEREAQIRVVTAAADSLTWHPAAELTIDPTYRARFRALEREDKRARITRVAWASAVTVTLALLGYHFLLPAISAAMVAGVGAL